jgi:hypothetical protein
MSNSRSSTAIATTTTTATERVLQTSFPQPVPFQRPTISSVAAAATAAMTVVSAEEQAINRLREELSGSMAHMLLQAEDEFSLQSFVQLVRTLLPTFAEADVRAVLQDMEGKNRIFVDGDTVYKV